MQVSIACDNKRGASALWASARAYPAAVQPLTFQEVILTSVAAVGEQAEGERRDLSSGCLLGKDVRDLQLWTDTKLCTTIFGYTNTLEDALEVACRSAEAIEVSCLLESAFEARGVQESLPSKSSDH